MRIALGIAYNGADYHGWQRQENVLSIQECLEDALSKIADQTIETFCAGRTDKGVHAISQVIHFDTHVIRSEHAWVLGTNTHLPPEIRVHWAYLVDENFHARFTAQARAYRYIIFNNANRSALLPFQTTWQIDPLDEMLMHQAAQHLVGEHDFTSFRALQCQAKSPVRNVHYIKVQRQAKFIQIDIKANGFLHHMVRNIAGVLMEIGAGEKPIAWVKEVLQARDRALASVTAPAAGLYFAKVDYPKEYEFPEPVESWFI